MKGLSKSNFWRCVFPANPSHHSGASGFVDYVYHDQKPRVSGLGLLSGINVGGEEHSLSTISIVDIFAGPGGLAEGFSSVLNAESERAFKVELSIEKDAAAHSTLCLRAFLRQFDGRLPDEYYACLNGDAPEPDWSVAYPDQWAAAEAEAWQLELGQEDATLRLNDRIDAIREKSGGKAILIGGPPCQAYSMAGRSRNQAKEDYVASEDKRHFLYEEYIRILDRLQPAAFVMENVKGMLSSSVDGKNRIFDKILEDLKGELRGGVRYKLIALDPQTPRQSDLLGFEPEAADFIVRAEHFGVPQARHRVIIVGIRQDIAVDIPELAMPRLMARHAAKATVNDAIGDMPKLRSGLSRETDNGEAWKRVVLDAMTFVMELDTGLPDEQQAAFEEKAALYYQALSDLAIVPGREAYGVGLSKDCPAHLRTWLLDAKLKNLPNHSSRSHMTSDLVRYFYAAVFAEVSGVSPKASNFPEELAPDHENWESGNFADRFRVQVKGLASTTVTSHISKDGHYFIHPDPLQCRSLTVREAARLQTFPDNYLFKGNRTQQYVQVGNAVPPLLAKSIGEALWSILIGRLTAAEDQASQALSNVA